MLTKFWEKSKVRLLYGPSPSYKRDNFQAEIFSFFVDSFLLKIKCSANNPDVMMPSYKLNRLASVFFVIFSFVGTFLIMNLLTGKFHWKKSFSSKLTFWNLTAVIYNQFRGYLRTTLQNSLNRRQIAFFGAFHKLLESDKVLADETRLEFTTFFIEIFKTNFKFLDFSVFWNHYSDFQ